VLGGIKDRNIWLIYGATVLLTIAYGIAVAVLSVFLEARGYTKERIGDLAVIFAAGVASFALPVGRIIKRASARTTLIVATLGYAVVIALFPYVVKSFWLAAVVRFIDGACSVSIWVSCETILLSRATSGQKAYITSLYAVSIGVGYLLGPFVAPGLMSIMVLDMTYVVAGVLSAASALLLWLRLDPDVQHDGPEGALSKSALPASSLLWRIKTSCFGTFAYGYFQASIVLFMPLFLIESKGVEKRATVALFGFFALGMLLSANPAGRLGDKYGHLLLMRILGAIGCGVVACFIYIDHYWLMAAAVAAGGATLASISPISLALQGVLVSPLDYRRSNALYNVFYAAGMLSGPFISSRIFEHAGGSVMMLHLAGLWAAFVLFTIVFAADDPARGFTPSQRSQESS
jgi:MFS family permease